MKTRFASFLSVLVFFSSICSAQEEDNRTQYPHWLQNSYIEFGVGWIDYDFSSVQMESGNTVESVKIPHLAARVTLLGVSFNKNFSAQLNYMRPVEWVAYTNVNGKSNHHTTWMNVAGVTVRGTLPIKKFAVYAEGGLGIVTRNGFDIDG